MSEKTRAGPCWRSVSTVYGTTSTVYGTTNADAGVGIGLKGYEKGHELADKAIY